MFSIRGRRSDGLIIAKAAPVHIIHANVLMMDDEIIEVLINYMDGKMVLSNLLISPLLQTSFTVAGMGNISVKFLQPDNRKTYANSLFFLFRLSFLIEFRCAFRLAAASGFVVICSKINANAQSPRNIHTCMTLASLRPLRTPKTLCRIWLYVFENLVVPTFACTKSCSSTASVFSSSARKCRQYSGDEQGRRVELTHLRITNCIVICDPIHWR